MKKNIDSYYRYHLIALFSICVLSAIIYSNTLRSPFVLDDMQNIVSNSHIRMTKLNPNSILDSAIGHTKNRPLPMLTFGLNYYFGQYNVKGYHFVNIIIHITNSILLFFFAKITLTLSKDQSLNHSISQSLPCEMRSLSDQGLDHTYVAFFTALLWLVSPLHTNSVTYIVQRMNSMVAMFYILSMLLYAKGRIKQIQRTGNLIHGSGNPKLKIGFYHLYFTGAFISGICALGCKETSATLPFLIILYELYFFGNLGTNRIKMYLWWISGAAVLFTASATVYLCFDSHLIVELFPNLKYNLEDFSVSQRILTEFRVVVYYISLLLFSLPSMLVPLVFTLRYCRSETCVIM